MKRTVFWLALVFLVGCSGLSPDFKKGAARTFQLIEDGKSTGSSITKHDVDMAMTELKVAANSDHEKLLLSHIEICYHVVTGDPEITNEDEQKSCATQVRAELSGDFDEKDTRCATAFRNQTDRLVKKGDQILQDSKEMLEELHKRFPHKP
jgi:hypothetical protein